MKPRRFWAGFIDGSIDTRLIDDQFGGYNLRKSPVIFTNRREAREQYQDIRPVVIMLEAERRKRKA